MYTRRGEQFKPTWGEGPCDRMKSKGFDLCWEGELVPNHNKRPELLPLRDPEVYCEGGSTAENFWGQKRMITLQVSDEADMDIGQGNWLETVERRAWESFGQICNGGENENMCSVPIWKDQCDIVTKQVQLDARFFPGASSDGFKWSRGQRSIGKGKFEIAIVSGGFPEWDSWDIKRLVKDDEDDGGKAVECEAWVQNVESSIYECKAADTACLAAGECVAAPDFACSCSCYDDQFAPDASTTIAHRCTIPETGLRYAKQCCNVDPSQLVRVLKMDEDSCRMYFDTPEPTNSPTTSSGNGSGSGWS